MRKNLTSTSVSRSSPAVSCKISHTRKIMSHRSSKLNKSQTKNHKKKLNPRTKAFNKINDFSYRLVFKSNHLIIFILLKLTIIQLFFGRWMMIILIFLLKMMLILLSFHKIMIFLPPFGIYDDDHKRIINQPKNQLLFPDFMFAYLLLSSYFLLLYFYETCSLICLFLWSMVSFYPLLSTYL
jgi:hypothetical protein